MIPQPIQINRNSPQAMGLIGWWTVSGGNPTHGKSPIPDLSGYGNPANLRSTSITVIIPDGLLGARRQSYNGGDYGQHVIANAALWNESDDLTVSGWFNFRNLTDYNVLASRWDENVNQRCWAIEVETAGIRLDTSAAGGFESGNVVSIHSVLSVGIDYHIACVHNSVAQTNKIYINGVNRATTPSVAAGIYDGTLNNWIMYSPKFAGLERGLDGSFTDVRIYKRALTDQNIWSLYDPATRWELYTFGDDMSWIYGSAATNLARSWAQIIG